MLICLNRTFKGKMTIQEHCCHFIERKLSPYKDHGSDYEDDQEDNEDGLKILKIAKQHKMFRFVQGGTYRRKKIENYKIFALSSCVFYFSKIIT